MKGDIKMLRLKFCKDFIGTGVAALVLCGLLCATSAGSGGTTNVQEVVGYGEDCDPASASAEEQGDGPICDSSKGLVCENDFEVCDCELGFIYSHNDGKCIRKYGGNTRETSTSSSPPSKPSSGISKFQNWGTRNGSQRLEDTDESIGSTEEPDDGKSKVLIDLIRGSDKVSREKATEIFSSWDDDGDNVLDLFEINNLLIQMTSRGYVAPIETFLYTYFYDKDKNGVLDPTEFGDVVDKSRGENEDGLVNLAETFGFNCFSVDSLEDFLTQAIGIHEWHQLDTDSDGCFDIFDFTNTLAAFGVKGVDEFQTKLKAKVIQVNFDNMWKKADVNRDNRLYKHEMDQFLSKYYPDLQIRYTAAGKVPVSKVIFSTFDLNSDGEITLAELFAWRDILVNENMYPRVFLNDEDLNTWYKQVFQSMKAIGGSNTQSQVDISMRLFDQDKSGSIDKLEMLFILALIRRNWVERGIGMLMSNVDVNNDSLVSLEEYLFYYTDELETGSSSVSDGSDAKVLMWFKYIDSNFDSFITKEELMTAKLSEEEEYRNEASFKTYDFDEDGILTSADSTIVASIFLIPAGGAISKEKFLSTKCNLMAISASMQELNANFRDVDQDGDRKVSRTEMERFVNNYGLRDEDTVPYWINWFIKNSRDELGKVMVEQAKVVFTYADGNLDNVLTQGEFEYFMKEFTGKSSYVVRKVFLQLDKDGDDRISLYEFDLLLLLSAV